MEISKIEFKNVGEVSKRKRTAYELVEVLRNVEVDDGSLKTANDKVNVWFVTSTPLWL